MGLLKIISRNSNKPARPDSDHLDDEEDPLSFVSTAFINRPAPLDPRVEQELRKSCAVILAGLKPSGFDIEDTRMKSDMLLDEQDRDGTHYSNSSSRGRAEGSSRYALPELTAEQPVRSGRSQNLTRYSDSSQTSAVHSSNTQAQIQSLMSPLEGPLAPAPSTIPASLASPRQVPFKSPARHVDSSDYSPSLSYTSATDQSKYASTGLTSANLGSAQTSQRGSEQQIKPIPAAFPGSWMKESVEKHLAAQDAVSPTVNNFAFHGQDDLATPAKSFTSQPVASSFVPSNIPWSHRQTNSNAPKSPETASFPAQDTTTKHSMFSRQDTAQQPSNVNGSKSVSTTNGLGQFGKINERYFDQKLQPVSVAAEPLSALKARSSNVSEVKNNDFVPPSRPANHRIPSSSSARVPGPGILKHVNDEGVAAKDFWKPSNRTASLTSASRINGPASRDHPSSSPGPEAGNFDALMSSMSKDPQNKPAALVRPSSPGAASTNSKTKAPPPAIPSRTSSMGNRKAPPTLSHSTNGSQTQQTFISLPMMALSQPMSPNTALGSHGVNGMSALNPNSPRYAVNGDDTVWPPPQISPTVMSPPRLSTANSTRTGISTASAKDRRGFKAFFHKLGGGDTVPKKKVYVPPPVPAYTDGEYWSDEEDACAAPVVPFGRGW